MKAKELRDKSTGERQTLFTELLGKATKLRFAIANREERNHRGYRALKKDIARLKTLARAEETK